MEGIERLRVKLLLMGRGETVGLGDVASVVARGRNVGVVVGERDVSFFFFGGFGGCGSGGV